MNSLSPAVETLVGRVRDLEPFIRDQAEVADEQRQLPRPLVDALHDAGLMRMYVPERYGGAGLTPMETLPIVEAVSRIDASVGWAMNIGAGSIYFGSLLDDESEREAVLAEPRGAGAGSGNPTSYRITRAPGGYRATGRSGFATACTFATNVTIGGAVYEGDSDTPIMGPTGPEVVFGLVPIDQVQIIDTWNATGLRGTGSHDVAVHDVFIPESRTFNLFAARYRADDPYSCVPLLHRFAGTMVGVGLGAAQHAIDAFVETADKKVAGGDFVLVKERAIARIELARAMALVGSARAYALSTMQRVHDLTYGGRPVELGEMAALRLALVTAAAQCAEATDIIRVVSGTTGMNPKSPIERCWRDAHAVQSHTGFGTHNLEKVGMVAFGMEPPGGI
jgi:alkylation response protein AidB-like acyl-CoA dehydrogenase